MKKSFKISISCLAIGGFLLGGQLLLAVEPEITVDTHLNFGAYTVTPIQLNQGENIECDLKEDDTTECENATPYGSFAQVGEFTITPGYQHPILRLWGIESVYIKVSYREGLLDLEEAGVALEFKFDGGTLANARLHLRGGTAHGIAYGYNPLVFNPHVTPVIGLRYELISGIEHTTQSAFDLAIQGSVVTIKVYGKLTVSDPLKFFAYRTKHNIKDVSKLLGALDFKVDGDDDALFPPPLP